MNGTSFDELSEFKDVGEVPEVGQSTYEEVFAANTHRIDFLVFVKGRRHPIEIVHNKRSGFVTIEACGKPQKSWQVVNLLDAF